MILPRVVEERINGLLVAAMANFNSGASGPSAVKGAERELFVDQLLAPMFPAPVRFGTGSISDFAGQQSGQIDLVMEQDTGFSFPNGSGSGPRFYIADFVAAAIEVKSDLSNQWDEVEQTAAKLACVRRTDHLARVNMHIAGVESGEITTNSKDWLLNSLREDLRKHRSARLNVPLYVVGFKGWKRDQTLREKVSASPNVKGVFIIDQPRFISSAQPPTAPITTGARSLVSLLQALQADFAYKHKTYLNPFMPA